MIPFLLVSKLSGALQKLVCPHNPNQTFEICYLTTKLFRWQMKLEKSIMSTLET